MSEIMRLVASGWPQMMAIFYIIWWSRMIDVKSTDHTERLNRHERRLVAIEQNVQLQAVQFARIEETLKGLKFSVDRIYEDMQQHRRGDN